MHVQTTWTSLTFNPLTDEDQSLMCRKLELQKLPELDALGSSSFLGEPCTTKKIKMDGNCFFRALSFAISGTEENHRRLRLLTVKHLLENSRLFSPYLRDGHVTVERYVQSSRMKYLHTWATEVEILAASDMLQTDIYTHSDSWLLFSKSQAQEQMNNSTRAIYLHHVSGCHYDVVICVKNQSLDLCTGNCLLCSNHSAEGIQSITHVKCEEDDNIIKDDAVGSRKDTGNKCFGKELKKNLHRERIEQKRLKTVHDCNDVINKPSAELQHTKKEQNTYAANVSYRRRVLAAYKEKYAKLDHRESSIRQGKQRYSNDELYQNRIKAYSKAKYLSDTRHKQKVKAYSKERYLSDTRHKQKVKAYSKEKYLSDTRHKQKVKAYSKEKYLSDTRHKQKVKAYSKEKYLSDTRHKQKVKAYSKEKYLSDTRHKQKVKAYSKEKYLSDTRHKQKVKAYSKEKYLSDTRHKQKVKAYSKGKYMMDTRHKEKVKTYSKRKYMMDTRHKEKVKTYSKRKYMMDTRHKENVKTYSKRKYMMDTRHKENVKTYSKRKYMDDEFRKNRQSQLKRKYSESEAYRKDVINRQLERRRRRIADLSCIDNVTSVFHHLISDAPHHICAVCHRRFFRGQVVTCKRESYSQIGQVAGKLAAKCISTRYVHTCSSDCNVPCIIYLSPYSKLWICYTCHRKIRSGILPAEASVNSLQVEGVPYELSCLNQLEQHLIAKHIPFAKVAALPRGGQRSVHGPVVCVPSNIDTTISSLPRPESDDQLIRVKLKRKLSYKGHYRYQFVNTARIERALEYLKENNPHYQDVNFNNNWVNNLSSAGNDKESDNDSLPDLCDHEQAGSNEGKKADLGNDAEYLHSSHTGDQGLMIDSCLQPVDIGQEILDQFADNVLCLAPSEGNDPIRLLMNEENEAKAFPVLFPKGSPTYHDEREKKITISRYLNTRLMHADCRFAKSTEYIFYAQYLSEVQQVLSTVSIALRKSHQPDTEQTINKLTDYDSLREILKTDSGFKFLKPIRGTPVYWQSAQKDLFAMLRQLGIPTWFCSFSAADMRWPEFIQALVVEEGRDIDITDMEWSAKCELIRENPVMAARMFEHRFQCFLKEFLLSPANPVGKIIDYFYRVEFQHRGSPHTHCLFWVENAPKLDHNSDEEVTAFIDKYVTCEMPPSDDEVLQEIVSSVQKHSSLHSKSCRKKGTNCRFNFPRPPSKYTFISRPSSSDVHNNDCNEASIEREMNCEEAKRILEALWEALSNQEHAFGNTEDLFTAVGINQDQFQEAYTMLSKRASVVLRRGLDDVWLNQYNPDLLRAWNGNMDIQFVLDAYSCIVYIISYISKSEREMGLLLEQARKETLNGNEDTKQALKKLGAVYLQSREVSAQEAVFRVCNLHLKECSRLVQFIPVGDAIKMSLPLNVIQNKLSGGDLNVDDVWMTSIIDRYKNRPDGDEFEAMCLATFCSEFRVLPKTEKISSKAQKEGLVHKLSGNMGYIRRRTRTKPAVVRYPRFSPENQSEKYFQSILQLFLPYRTDSQLKPDGFNSFEYFFETGAVSLLNNTSVELVKDIVNRNKASFETDADQITRAAEILEMGGHLEDAWAQMYPETEAERISCFEEIEELDKVPCEAKDIPDLVQNQKSDYTIEPQQGVLSGSEAKDLLRSLNERQLEVFYKVRKWCLEKLNDLETEPFYLFITGGAGTGKTHLIRSLHFEANRLLARCLSKPDDTSVLITAPTGVAAFNISASTIHSTFSIPVDVKLPYQPLGEEKLNTLRSKYNSLQILIIDEISMVDHKLLAYIHGRLRQIKQCKDYSPFGKVSVIAVGDFYQLPPVKGKPLYKDDIGFNLWSEFKIVELTEVMRQKDQSFANMLNRLRIRKKTERITASDICMLTKRENGDEEGDIHIFATNQQVAEFNLSKLSQSEEEIFAFDAQDFEKDQRTGKLQKRDNQFISTVYSNLPRKLSLTVGARVLLMKNIDVSDGLVNGVFGTVSHIPCPARGEDVPNVIYVVFDSDRVGIKMRRESQIPDCVPSSSTPIHRVEDRKLGCLLMSQEKDDT
ncbi:uncharacterized protein LOC135481415 [Liolophura sinensis]|uniref:uncharacterized protein LOC135481415 n=1 Tax=Liolophura sinensis TaxID=3198878 RepID=UPI003158093C